MIKKIFKKLYTLQSLNELESIYIFDSIINNKLTPIEITVILILMHVKKTSIVEITGAIKTFQKYCLYFPKPKCQFADIVGTGGDGKNTINISTLSALVASSCGLKIIKHCNQGISSTLGSADILKKMHINIQNPPKTSRKIFDQTNICFLFAPQYHIGLHHVKSIRKKLKIRTIFNILGPMLNPAQPPLSVIGVYSKNLLLPIAKVVNQLKNYQKVIIIHSDGIDEVTLHSHTDIYEIYNGKITTYKLYPEDFGIKRVPKKFFINNSSIKNFQIFKNICQGHANSEYENLIAVNTAIIFKLFGFNDLKQNTQIALKKIRSGDIQKHVCNISKIR
ncbi:anthranilate phosphoribosyltransferase [Buchnera aphidicola (Stegophylla sp.)]|nr:anthranilate phosphoribosyltransferase [Buchnera aphidicola (Stegophylla sp.)]